MEYLLLDDLEEKQEKLKKAQFFGGTLLSFHIGVALSCFACRIYSIHGIWLAIIILLVNLSYIVYAYNSKEEYIAAGKKPIITHYTGNFYVERRPWIENSDHPHKDAYIKYRNMSPWKESVMVSDKRNYKKRLMSKVCKSLPRFLMLSFVSFLYNIIRPIYFESKLKEMRHK